MQPHPYPASYYADSAHPAPARPALDQDLTGGVCIIGGGYSGLSAGIALAELGHKVVLLEASGSGWGASGRNGGQIVNGLNASLDGIDKRYGADTARFVAGIVHEGGALIRDRVARYGIACDLKDGNIFAAFTEAHVKDLAAKKAVIALAADQQVIAVAAQEVISTAARAEFIVALFTGKPVIACSTKQTVIVIAAFQSVVARIAVKYILPVTASEIIIAAAAIEQVDPVTTIEHVAAFAAAQNVIAPMSGEAVSS